MLNTDLIVHNVRTLVECPFLIKDAKSLADSAFSPCVSAVPHSIILIIAFFPLEIFSTASGLPSITKRRT